MRSLHFILGALLLLVVISFDLGFPDFGSPTHLACAPGQSMLVTNYTDRHIGARCLVDGVKTQVGKNATSAAILTPLKTLKENTHYTFHPKGEDTEL